MRGLAHFTRSTALSNGMDAQRSSGGLLSSPAAVQRCAKGAGLDSGAPDEAQSAMPSIAARRRTDCKRRFHWRRPIRRPSATVPNLHQLDGRDQTTRFTYRPNHEWCWFPQQKPTEVSMLKCYDSGTDGSVSRWSFHTACIDPTAPLNARCRKNVVVRSFVFF